MGQEISEATDGCKSLKQNLADASAETLECITAVRIDKAAPKILEVHFSRDVSLEEGQTITSALHRTATHSVPQVPPGCSLFAINVVTGAWHYVNHARSWQTMPSLASTHFGDLPNMLSAAKREEGCTVFEHSAEEIGLEVMNNYLAVLAALKGTSERD